MQIVAEVLKGVAKHSIFLASMGESSGSRQKTTSHEHMRELEERLATQELAARSAADRYQEELNARMAAQQQEIQQMKARQQYEIAALKREHEEKNASMEIRQSQLEGTIRLLFRIQGGSENSASQPVVDNSMSQPPMGNNNMYNPDGGLLRLETLVVPYYIL